MFSCGGVAGDYVDLDRREKNSGSISKPFSRGPPTRRTHSYARIHTRTIAIGDMQPAAFRLKLNHHKAHPDGQPTTL